MSGRSRVSKGVLNLSVLGFKNPFAMELQDRFYRLNRIGGKKQRRKNDSKMYKKNHPSSLAWKATSRNECFQIDRKHSFTNIYSCVNSDSPRPVVQPPALQAMGRTAVRRWFLKRSKKIRGGKRKRFSNTRIVLDLFNLINTTCKCKFPPKICLFNDAHLFHPTPSVCPDTFGYIGIWFYDLQAAPPTMHIPVKWI